MIFSDETRRVLSAFDLNRTAISPAVQEFEPHSSVALRALAKIRNQDKWRLDLFHLGMRAVPNEGAEAAAWAEFPVLLASFGNDANIEMLYDTIS